MKSDLDFCGIHISGNGITIDDAAILAMCEYPQITSFKEVQQFLGSVRFFAEFVPWLADIAHPLFQLTKKDIINSGSFKDIWNTDHQMAVRTIQHHLVSPRILAFFDPSTNKGPY